ncbi:hypothetical protein BGZ98_008252, partial [Dissophora globulifera]
MSQMSLFDDHASSHSSLPSSPSTASLASSLLDARQLDSGIDLQESPRSFNRRSNRDFRVIPETDAVSESNLHESIRQSQTPPRRARQQDVFVGSVQGQASRHQERLPAVALDDNDDIEESYFGDILDKYCNSDEEAKTSMNASQTSLSSTTPGWSFNQPPASPASRPYNMQPTSEPRKRAPGATTATAQLWDNQSSSSLSSPSRASGHERTERGRYSSTQEQPSPTISPTDAFNARLNVYQQTAAKGSRESLSKTSLFQSSSPSLSSTDAPSTNTPRSYSKRPVPPLKDDSTTPFKATSSQPPVSIPLRSSSTSSMPSSRYNSKNGSRGNLYDRQRGNDSLADIMEAKPEPPPKDSTRKTLNTN